MKFCADSLQCLLRRCVSELREAMIYMGAASWLLDQGWLGLNETRSSLASKYLRGQGLEVGALGNPLPLPVAASVQYVDRVEREESLHIYPDASNSPHVTPDLVEDGFSLPTVKLESVDFVIGNHVLEHAPDFFGALARWTDVIRENGHIFAAIPIASECFDRRRGITDPNHFLEDYQQLLNGSLTDLHNSTLAHCREYLTLACSEIYREMGQEGRNSDPLEVERRAQEMAVARVDMHYHTFSFESLKCALALFVTEVRTNMVIETVARSRIEIVFVLRKVKV